MFKWFKKEPKEMPRYPISVQEESTRKKLEMAERVQRQLDELHAERRFHAMPIEFERRKA